MIIPECGFPESTIICITTFDMELIGRACLNRQASLCLASRSGFRARPRTIATNTTTSSSYSICMKNAAIYHDHNDKTPVLRDVTWSILPGSHWVVVGPVGSGKTTLAKAASRRLAIQQPPPAGAGEALADTLASSQSAVEEHAYFVSFQAAGGGSYYSRYNGLDEEDDTTLAEYLQQGLVEGARYRPHSISTGVARPVYGMGHGHFKAGGAGLGPAGPAASASSTNTSSTNGNDGSSIITSLEDSFGDATWTKIMNQGFGHVDPRVASLAVNLGLQHLLHQSLVTLSYGQLRRARITWALLSSPALLALDEPFAGLDAALRERTASLLSRVAADGRTQLLLALREQDWIPPWITNVIQLDGNGGIAWQGSRSGYEARQLQQKAMAEANRIATRNAQPSLAQRIAAQPRPNPYKPGLQPLVQLTDINITYKRGVVVRNVSWTVLPGERWGLIGPSGSGKTTLLALMLGDHLQAYSNDVKLFGRRRGYGDDIWEIRKNVSFLSPELHGGAFTAPGLTAMQVIATGWQTSVSADGVDPTTEQRDAIEVATAQMDLQHQGIDSAWLQLPFASLPSGQQRLVLFLRSIVKVPQLLVLDEPFQGMDRTLVHAVHQWLGSHLKPTQAMVCVTHYPDDELPPCTNRMLRLGEGGVVAELI